MDAAEGQAHCDGFAAGSSDVGHSTTCAIEEALRRLQLSIQEQSIKHRSERDSLVEQLILEEVSRRKSFIGGFKGFAESFAASSDFRSEVVEPTQSSQVIFPVETEQRRSRTLSQSTCDSHSDWVARSTMLARSMTVKLEDQAFFCVEPTSAFAKHSVIDDVEVVLDLLVSQKDDEGGRGELTQRFMARLRALWTLQEPERTGVLAEFVRGNKFGSLCTMAISFNAVFLSFTTDYQMSHPNKPATSLMSTIELCLMVFYMIELIFKLCVHRFYFFWCNDTSWNVFDFTLVCLSVVELVFSILEEQDASGINHGFMRALKLLKLARVLRVIRSIRCFAEPRLVFSCVMGSIVNCFWSLVAIVLIIYMFSLLIVQGIAHKLGCKDPPWTPDEQLAIQDWFGTIVKAMMTLMQSATGGIDWAQMYKLLESGGDVLAWFYLMYIVFFSLAAWNIITSLFVEKAAKLAPPDIDTVAAEKSAQDALDAQALTSIFTVLDTDGSGKISLQELKSIMDHPKFRLYLRARGIEVTDAELFHKMLRSVVDDGEPDADINFIVAACLRMKGGASSMDLHALSFESRTMSRRLRQDILDITERLYRIEGAMEALADFKLTL